MSAWLDKLTELCGAGVGHALVTITAVSGSTPRGVGAKMIVCADGTFFDTIGGGQLEALAIADARACIAAGASRSFRYPLGAAAGQCCGGVVDLFVDVMPRGPELWLFGAGHVGQAVCNILNGTAFTVHVIDERSEWIDAPGLSRSAVRHAEPWDAFLARATSDARRTHVAVMTHRHDVDQAIVEALLRNPERHPLRYLGLIGSRAKWARFCQRLLARGLTGDQLARVQCPLGLPIGGKAPQEVAISLAAQLVQSWTTTNS